MRIATCGLLCSVLLLPACGSSVPLGPDLVDCECSCTTSTGVGNVGPNSCGDPNLCDPPCAGNAFCSGTGGCVGLCDPGLPPQEDFTSQAGATLHVCVDSSNPTFVAQACADRCSNYASGSLVTCVEAVVDALGVDIDAIKPSAAQSVEQIIVEECGTFLLDTLTGTCGLETPNLGASLKDLFLCLVSASSDAPLGGGVVNGTGPGGAGPAGIRTCALTGTSVRQINGCPEFPGTPHSEGTPVGGSPLPASADIDSDLSLVSISGPAVSPRSAKPSGNASIGRVGPMIFLGKLSGTLPNGDLVVNGHDVTLSGGFLELKGPVAGVLNNGVFTIPAGKLHFLVTGNLSGTVTSVEGFNITEVIGRYSEILGLFDLSATIDLVGLQATVTLDLTFHFTNRPPQANAGPDQTIECSVPETREGVVPLSAAQSAELDSGDHITSYAWSLGRQFVAQGSSASEVSAHAGLGTWVAKLTTIDTHGSIGRDASLITVQDTQPPIFDSVTVTPSCLWPPNHKMVLLRLGKELIAKVHDGCDSAPTVFIKSVESNEPAAGHGSGNTSPDLANGSAAACVRAERDGNSKSSRIYKITLAARDFEGHQSEQVVEVTVPHDQGHGEKCSNLDDTVIVADGDPRCLENVPDVAAAVPQLTGSAATLPQRTDNASTTTVTSTSGTGGCDAGGGRAASPWVTMLILMWVFHRVRRSYGGRRIAKNSFATIRS
jgi:hypothetical protein